MTFLILILPVLAGLLLRWISRNERRREYVQQRLRVLTQRIEDEDIPSLTRTMRQQAASFIPRNFRASFDAEFDAAGNRIGPISLGFAGLFAAIVVAAFTEFVMGFNPVVVALFSLVAVSVAPVITLRIAQSRYRNRFLDVFPDALDLVRRGIRSGLPVNEALVVAAREISDPVGSELRRALEQVQVGVQMTDALQATSDRIRVADFRFMVVALTMQQKTGGSLAETLANLSSVIRARRALRLKARALSAEAKVSAMVLAALPFLVGGAMWVMNRGLVQPLIVDPRGRFMVGLAFTSLLAGLTVMYILVRRAVR